MFFLIIFLWFRGPGPHPSVPQIIDLITKNSYTSNQFLGNYINPKIFQKIPHVDGQDAEESPWYVGGRPMEAPWI